MEHLSIQLEAYRLGLLEPGLFLQPLAFDLCDLLRDMRLVGQQALQGRVVLRQIKVRIGEAGLDQASGV